MAEPRRCGWCGDDALYQRYHDEEWGVPQHDDVRLFEMLVLEGAQAGLSWLTILRKRAQYRQVYAGFDPRKVARFDRRKLERLLTNPGIVRNRLKVEASIQNARKYLDVQEEFGTFDRYLSNFVDGRVIRNRPKTADDVPANTPLSDEISKDLKRRGFKFVGSTIIYAFMQSVGVVDDHLRSCFKGK